MAKLKTIWVCSECGNETPKWVGKCPSCGSWDTYYEEKAQNIKARDDKSVYTDMDGKKIEVVKLIDTPKNVYTRMSTGYNEADRVLRWRICKRITYINRWRARNSGNQQ
jgi:DNA repair protein radA